MAAIDPTEEIEDEDDQPPRRPRSTLKLIKERRDNDDDDSDDDKDYLQALLNGQADDGGDESDDEEDNGGPSDPSKSKKALRNAALQKLLKVTNEEGSDEEMDDDDCEAENTGKKVNGEKAVAKGKGKEKVVEAVEDEEESDDNDESYGEEDGIQSMNLQPFAVCTLDTEAHYQQPLDLTITASERAFFVNSGTHTIYLTGNYVVHDDDLRGESDDSEVDSDDEYDLPPELEDLVGDDLEDELDNIDGADRIKEVDTDEEVEGPQLVDAKKGKNKRAADGDGLDELIAQGGKSEESKLKKKQTKKLKNNEGKAVPTEETPKSEKKVQFAKNLEQGPTGSPIPMDSKKKAAKKTPSVRVEQGVTIDDRKVGTGRVAKAGDRVGMRYIGKLENGKVFDANKKGPPFAFKLGKGEVIEGWDIGVKGMAIGGERRLTVPAIKAYGSKALPGIPANSTLIFDIKLLEIK